MCCEYRDESVGLQEEYEELTQTVKWMEQFAKEMKENPDSWHRFFEVSSSRGWYKTTPDDLMTQAIINPDAISRAYRSITGPGGTFEYPIPMQHEPYESETVWEVDLLSSELAIETMWRGKTASERASYERGLLHGDRNSALKHAVAIIKALGEDDNSINNLLNVA